MIKNDSACGHLFQNLPEADRAAGRVGNRNPTCVYILDSLVFVNLRVFERLCLAFFPWALVPGFSSFRLFVGPPAPCILTPGSRSIDDLGSG